MMYSAGQVKSGETVLVLGASGGVGTATVILSKLAGANVIACAGTDEKCGRLRGIGADETINYTTVEFDDYIRKRQVRFTAEAAAT